MKKLIAVVLMSMFAVGAFAADAAKKDEKKETAKAAAKK